LSGAARAYADAFEREHEEIVTPLAEDEERVVVGTVVVTGMDMPFDVVLRSSVEAAAALVGRKSLVGGNGHGGTRVDVGEKLPVRSWCEGDSTVSSLVVRVMGAKRR
jgi:hypothetical protein